MGPLSITGGTTKTCPNVTTEFCTCQKFGSKIDQGLKVRYILTHKFIHLILWALNIDSVAGSDVPWRACGPWFESYQICIFFAYMLNVKIYSFWKLTQLSLLVPNLSLLIYFDITLSRQKSSKIEGSGPPTMSHSIQPPKNGLIALWSDTNGRVSTF